MEASSIIDFKSTTLYAIRVVLHSADMPAILAALDQRMQEAAGFFEDEPVVIDASRLTEALDWAPLLAALAAHRLPPIGVMAQGALLETARAAGLVQVSLPTTPARPAPKPAEAGETPAADKEAAAPAAAPPAPEPAAQPARAETVAAAEIMIEPKAPTGAQAVSTMVVDRPLRSGQKVYARHADLIVLGIVSHGAEVIADGNIHVYGPLRGKAMAGARGNTASRIFTTQFEAELVAIAGVYRSMTAALAPDIQNKPASVRLDGEKLLVEPLAI